MDRREFYSNLADSREALEHSEGFQRANHKYINRFRGRNGKWIYEYAEDLKEKANATAAKAKKSLDDTKRTINTIKNSPAADKARGYAERGASKVKSLNVKVRAKDLMNDAKGYAAKGSDHIHKFMNRKKIQEAEEQAAKEAEYKKSHKYRDKLNNEYSKNSLHQEAVKERAQREANKAKEAAATVARNTTLTRDASKRKEAAATLARNNEITRDAARRKEAAAQLNKKNVSERDAARRKEAAALDAKREEVKKAKPGYKYYSQSDLQKIMNEERKNHMSIEDYAEVENENANKLRSGYYRPSDIRNMKDREREKYGITFKSGSRKDQRFDIERRDAHNRRQRYLRSQAKG